MRKLLITLALALCAGLALAADIVTMPTANQLKKGEVEVAAYYLNLDLPPAAPQNVWYQTLYVGVTDWLELDLHRADVDNDKVSTVLVASVKVLSETAATPDVVIGARNITGERTTNNPAVANLSEDTSFFVSAAKTFFLGEQPGPPLARLHLSYGNADWTLLGEARHNGFFGGAQFLITPQIGAVAIHDGTDLITGLTFMPQSLPGLTLKAGTYGDHQWIGAAYTKALF
ncbi:MAG TPA: hypothetical protein PLZ36_14460 [Armatimonadota bacterium]|nr:hypothetical protein [Armatimonadota bacterium]